MAGAYRMAMSRATVEQLDADGNTVDRHSATTVTLRDGQAVMRRSTGTKLAEAEVVEVEPLAARNSYRMTMADGTTWLVSKPCNCGGSR